MQQHYSFDAIVIGSGPGGEGAAMGLVKQGARVAVIERHFSVGGGCTHWGTIPSKALRHAVSRIIEFNQNPLYSDNSRILKSTFPDILRHADSVINQQTRMRQGFYERNHCQLFSGDAEFIDANTISVSYPDGTRDTLSAKISSLPVVHVRIIHQVSISNIHEFTIAIPFCNLTMNHSTSLFTELG